MDGGEPLALLAAPNHAALHQHMSDDDARSWTAGCVQLSQPKFSLAGRSEVFTCSAVSVVVGCWFLGFLVSGFSGSQFSVFERRAASSVESSLARTFVPCVLRCVLHVLRCPVRNSTNLPSFD